VPATHEHSGLATVFMGGRDKPGHDELLVWKKEKGPEGFMVGNPS